MDGIAKGGFAPEKKAVFETDNLLSGFLLFQGFIEVVYSDCLLNSQKFKNITNIRNKLLQ